jgi:hypothetical protein
MDCVTLQRKVALRCKARLNWGNATQLANLPQLAGRKINSLPAECATRR